MKSGEAERAAVIQAEVPYLNTSLDQITVSYEQRSFDFAIEKHVVPMRNARLLVPAPSLDREGFLLAHWPSHVVRERRDELIKENSAPREDMPNVNTAYVDELLPLIARISGAREVFAQYGTITVRFSSRAAHRSWMTTAAFAHMDFETSDIDRLLKDTLELTGKTVAPFRRQVLFQAWRVITDPPQDMPLTLCDGRTVRPEEKVRMDFLGPKGSRNEHIVSRACRYDLRHQWFYYPDMSIDEVLIFKGYDSDCPEALNAMHTAFDDTSVSEAVPRGSIECRYIALYD